MSIAKHWLSLACLVCIATTAQEAQFTNGPKFRYQSECGDPTRESSSWSTISGTVMKVVSVNKIQLRLTKNQKLIDVTLIAISTPSRLSKTWGIAKNEVTKNILGKIVEVVLQQGSEHSDHLFGVILIDGEDLNFKLIEHGLCKFKKPPAYFMSDYTACTYQQIEKEARKYKRGLWGD